MAQTSFDQMSSAQLQAYMLEHRDDEAAFHAYMDRLYASPGMTRFPADSDVRTLLEAALRRKRGEQ